MPFIPPMPPRDTRPDGERGFVSLRDRLAMVALTGMLGPGGAASCNGEQVQFVSEMAYKCADAMLKAREVK